MVKRLEIGQSATKPISHYLIWEGSTTKWLWVSSFKRGLRYSLFPLNIPKGRVWVGILDKISRKFRETQISVRRFQ